MSHHHLDYAARIRKRGFRLTPQRELILDAICEGESHTTLDEPTAGLDPRARRSLIELLRTLSQTLIVSTHNMRLVQELCSRTVILDQGRLVADGPTENILNDETLLFAHGLERP